jgi:hypothetical protein
MEEKTITHLTCGGYLQYEDSYAERGMMRPVKLGSPRIRLDSYKHDLHVSLIYPFLLMIGLPLLFKSLTFM